MWLLSGKMVAGYFRFTLPALLISMSAFAQDVVALDTNSHLSNSGGFQPSYLVAQASSSAFESTNQVTGVARPVPDSGKLLPSLDASKSVTKVLLSGEVKHPGEYLLQPGETLSQLIVRSGGLTDLAYPYGAIVTREKIKQQQKAVKDKTIIELEQALIVAQRSRHEQKAPISTGLEAMLRSLIASLKGSSDLGRIMVEADPLVLASHPEKDVFLEPGDAIVIPKRSYFVTVAGHVLRAGTTFYQPSLTAQDYIQQVGGLTQLSDVKNAFIILPNGEVRKVVSASWLPEKQLSIPPGSTVYVPRDVSSFMALDLGIDMAKILNDLAIETAAISVIGR